MTGANEALQLLKQDLGEGTSYYDARQKLINEGFSEIDIDNATAALKSGKGQATYNQALADSSTGLGSAIWQRELTIVAGSVEQGHAQKFTSSMAERKRPLGRYPAGRTNSVSFKPWPPLWRLLVRVQRSLHRQGRGHSVGRSEQPAQFCLSSARARCESRSHAHAHAIRRDQTPCQCSYTR